MHKLSTYILTILLLISPIAVFADDLDDAKATGLVGERLDGYLGYVVKEPSNELKSLVKDINNRRKAKYEDIAKRNNTSLEAVQKLAGEKAIEKTPTGEYIQNIEKKWQRK